MYRVEPVENLWKTPVDKSASIGDCCDFWQESARRANRAQDLEFFFWAAGDASRESGEGRAMKPANCIIPAPEVRDYVVAMIARHGLLRTSRELGLSRQTVRTISLGGPCFRGSIAIVHEAMRARGES